MNQNPLVSIVILNWNGTEDTLHCIDSVIKIDYNNYEIIVVDNGSSEDLSSLEALQEQNVITLIKEPKNLGFTGGEIVGYNASHGEYILILNNDAIIEKSAVTEALLVFKTDKKIAAVGGRSYLLDDNGKKMGIHHYSHQRVDPITAEVHTYGKDEDEIREVSNVSGACVLIKRSVIEKIGYFDNSFFAYYEETDLFARFRRAGYKVVFSPKVVIWHKLGASTRNKKYMYNYLMLKNQFYFAYKNFDKDYLKLFMSAYRRHFRRSFLIYVKRLGRIPKHDLIHKARVDAYFDTIKARPRLRADRKKVFALNPSFSINDQYFEDNPIPVSIFIDATKITKAQEKNLDYNLNALASLSTRPAEVIVVSKKKLSIPATASPIRIATIIDKDRHGLTPYDFFFMTSNYDCILFGHQSFLNQSFTKSKLDKLALELKELYTHYASSETRAIISSDTNGVITPNDLSTENYDLLFLSKQMLVNHLDVAPFVDSITEDVLSDTIGRSVAQGLTTKKISTPSDFFGVKAGSIDSAFEPILSKPIAWRTKHILTKLHLWSVLVKIARRVGRVINRGAVNNLETPVSSEHIDSTNKNIPIVFNTRDRFEPLKEMVDWLSKNGYENIIFVDNDSSYPPLINFFKKSPYQIVSLGRNAMHKAPWESMAVRFFSKGGAYIVSDPDIIPDTDCPSDAIEYLCSLLNKYPQVNKVGLGLRIDNLPLSNNQRQHIIDWETRFWNKENLLEKNVYAADVDTTFAVYRPRTWWFLSPSIRTGGKYVAIHEPWYQSSTDPTEDFMFYRMRASREVSTWGMDELPKHHRRALKKEGYIDDIIDEDEED